MFFFLSILQLLLMRITVNSKILARILFSRIALKHIFAKFRENKKKLSRKFPNLQYMCCNQLFIESVKCFSDNFSGTVVHQGFFSVFW